MQTQWRSQLNPLLSNISNNKSILKGVVLISGTTIINHLLGQTMQGWSIVDQNASASIYRSQPFNDKTLTLVSSAAVTVNLEVF